MKAVLLELVVLLGLVSLLAAEIDEPCRKDAYPPSESSKLQTYTLNLDLPPTQRWRHIVQLRQKQIQDLIGVIKELVSKNIITTVDMALGSIIKWLPEPYGDEIKGVAAAANIPLGEAVLYNIFYEIFTACTSIIAQDETGRLYHGRNLDFGFLMGWDNKTNTWLATEKLRSVMVNVDYQSNGKTIYRAVHFAGYIGILTAVKQNMFTLTMNERFALDGGYVGMIEWLLGLTKGRWMGFLTRDVMLNATSFTEAKNMLANTPMLAPAYFILGGTKAGAASIITRSRQKAIDILDLDMSKGEWYLLETNYDHWKKPLFIDDRRTPGKKCMDEMSQKGFGFKSLFNVLTTQPILNKLTTYTALLQVDDGTLDTYIQNCPDPCWPF